MQDDVDGMQMPANEGGLHANGTEAAAAAQLWELGCYGGNLFTFGCRCWAGERAVRADLEVEGMAALLGAGVCCEIGGREGTGWHGEGKSME